jgi:hypothetical protein
MLFTTILITVAASLASAAPAADANTAPLMEARALRGGVDVDEACRQQYNGNYGATQTGNYCDGWKCVVDGRHRGINMDLYCVTKYGGDALAKCDDGWWGGVYNWECHDRA